MILRANHDRRRHGRRHGAALLEMAVVLPFLALVFVVALDFSRAFAVTQTVQNCANAGATYAAGNAQPGAATAEDAARDAAVAEGTKLTPPLRRENVAVSTGDTSVTVTVTYDFQLIVGFPGMGRTLTVVRSVTMPLAPQVGQ
jgi:Flp pilus assembly protein TadG